MNQLQLFNNPVFGELPVIIVDGKELFGAVEAALALTFAKPHNAINTHVDEDDSLVQGVTDALGRTQQKKFINESGLYSLIFGAAKQGNNSEIKEKAKKFKRWVTNEVLPSIRKTGQFSIGVPSYMIADPIERAEQWIEEQKEKQAIETKALMLEQRVAEYEPQMRYLDTILKSKGTMTITQIAKDYGMSGQALNQILHEEKVQYKQNKQWLLYRQHHAEGYTKSETIDITRSNGDHDVTLNTRWTQKGRLFIHEILKRRDIVPVMDRDKAEE